jgi:hypothetical protein
MRADEDAIQTPRRGSALEFHTASVVRPRPSLRDLPCGAHREKRVSDDERKRTGVRARLKSGARSAVERATARARAEVRDRTETMIVRVGGGGALDVVRAARELASGIDLERLGNGLHEIAGRIASVDPAAEELARWTEQLVAVHGRERVMRVVLLRNMLVDGSFVEILEGLLGSDDPLAVPSSEALDRARASVRRLLETLAELDGATLQDRFDDGSLARTQPHLDGTSDDAAFHRFCIWSYTLFLQSFLLRSVVETTGQLVSGLLPGRGARSENDPIDVDLLATSPRTVDPE